MMDEELIRNSRNGNIGKVKEILELSGTNVNYKNIHMGNFIDRISIGFFHEISNRNHLWNSFVIFLYTPLIYASENGHAEIVRLLLSQPGIEINCTNILIQRSIIIYQFNYFILFPFSIIFEIGYLFFLILL